MLCGQPPLKCMSASAKVASVSQRVRELRGSSASVTHAMEEYQGRDQDAAITQPNVIAQVAATTVGTSGDSRLYKYHARASMSHGHAKPMTVVTWLWMCRPAAS